MILQALVKHYETLADKGKVPKKGWCHAKISFALNLSKDGNLKGIIPLKEEVERGKKKVWIPQLIGVPKMVARSSGVSANFLCDNSKYLLGIDREGTNQRVLECFEAAKRCHLELLKGIHTEMAEAIVAFFVNWDPECAEENRELVTLWDEVTEGGNLIFTMGAQYAQNEMEIKKAWEESNKSSVGDAEGVCLVTGEKAQIARIHGMIKGVPGAQSSGAALVSFNAQAFESYGKEQSYNSSVGKYAAFAYTTTLNYLLSQREYAFQFGDTRIVFWAEDGESCYQDTFGWSVRPKPDNEEMLKGIFQALKGKKAIDIGGVKLDPEQKFYILGLAPNAARLSVRFFHQDSFGNILNNMVQHYDRMRIVKPSWEEREFLGAEEMLQETVNQKSKDKNPVSHMSAMVFQAILSASPYPESLYSNIMIRIRAEQGKVTWERAAIIKAYLIKNRTLEKGEEFMGLNEESDETAYVLGRIFSVLEAAQEESTDNKINTSIRDRYFNAACTAPESVFPILMKLKNSHMKKLDRDKVGLKIQYEKLLTNLMGKISFYPKHLTLEEQGKFILGYYHQVQKRYEKKEEK